MKKSMPWEFGEEKKAATEQSSELANRHTRVETMNLERRGEKSSRGENTALPEAEPNLGFLKRRKKDFLVMAG